MDYFAKLNTPQEKWDVYECENCGSVVRTGRLLLHHYSLMHKGSPEFKSKCLFSKNCYHQEYFKSYHALYQHLKQYHDSFFEKVNVTTDVQQNEQGIIMNNGTLSVTSFMFFNLLYILIVIHRC
jgi:hypothetical protein